MTELVFSGVDVGYASPVVRGADLTVAAGEVVGLIGPNGAGKTTLLRAVNGAARVSAGSVAVMGRDVREYDSRALARVVAVLPQATPVEFAFSVIDYVSMGRHPHIARLRDPGPDDRRAVQRALALTDTERLASTKVDALSGGDLQRVVLAQALAQEPRILLLDEPTSHLDVDHALQILDLVRDLAREGMAVLGVFHDLNLAGRYADRLAAVADGRLSCAGAPQEVLTPAVLGDVFGVRAVVGRDPVTGTPTVSPVLREAAIAPSSDTRVLVVGGAGEGAAVMRALVLAGHHVEAAALERGDTDSEVARALGCDAIDVPPFGEFDDEVLARVAAAALRADVIVISPTPFGRGNVGNLRVAVESGKPLVIMESAGERDFTDGIADALLLQALQEGAACAGGVDDVVRYVTSRGVSGASRESEE